MEKNREPAECDECGVRRRGSRYRIYKQGDKPGTKKVLWICEKCLEAVIENEET